MDYSNEIKDLATQFSSKDWYSDIGTDKNDIVIYTKFMNLDTLSSVPDYVNGKRVLIHFAVSKNLNKEKYVEVLSKPIEEEKELDMSVLAAELKELTTKCNANILEDIFYEIKDQKNALTNLSFKYPEIRTRLEVLYDEYGFDIIYELIEQ